MSDDKDFEAKKYFRTQERIFSLFGEPIDMDKALEAQSMRRAGVAIRTEQLLEAMKVGGEFESNEAIFGNILTTLMQWYKDTGIDVDEMRVIMGQIVFLGVAFMYAPEIHKQDCKEAFPIGVDKCVRMKKTAEMMTRLARPQDLGED